MSLKECIALIGETFIVIATVFWQILTAVYRTIVPKKKKSVQGEIVLITGAGSGIGRLLSIKFAQLGAKVICSDINPEGNQQTVEEIQKFGGFAYGIIFDCGNHHEVYAAAGKIRSEVGNVTILINNAGITSGDLIENIPDSFIEKIFHVNSLAAIWTTKAFLPHMKQRNHGHIVNVASSAGYGGVTRLSVYCASKFAAVGLSESLICELDAEGADGVHVTCVAPYFISTGMFEGVKARCRLLLDIITPESAAQRIVDGVLRDERIVLIPWTLRLLIILKSVLPTSTVLLLMRFLGVSKTMNTYVGRQEKKSS